MPQAASLVAFLFATVSCTPGLLAQNPPATIEYRSVPGSPEIRLGTATLTIPESRACQFNWIRAITFQSTGRIVVANSGNSELCIFGPNGQVVHRIGRKGAGPGEYQSIQGVQRLRADSLLVYDPSLRRVSILDSEGGYVRSIPLNPPSDTLGSVDAVAALTDGTFLVGYSEFRTGQPRPEPVTFTQRMFRYDTNGKLLDSIGRFFWSEHFIQSAPPTMGGIAYWDRAFGRRWSIGPVPGGFVAGEGTDFIVTQYSQTGSRVVLHRFPGQPRRVTPEHIAAYRQQSLKDVRPENAAIEERRLSEMPYPSTFPAFRRLLADAISRIWLERYPVPGEQSTDWVVLDLRTRHAALVTLPARFQLLAVRANLLCGVLRDEDDLESVQCFGLTDR